MDTLFSIVLITHLLSWAIVFGTSFAGMKTGEMPKGLLHGVLGALVAGIALVGIMEANDADVNHMKIGIKALITIIITAMAFWGNRKERLSAGFFGGIAALVAANVAIAVLV